MIRYGAERDMSMQSFLSKIFSPNPGEPHRPLSMTASGGELCSNQIAAFADRHFFVKKEIEDKLERATAKTKFLFHNMVFFLPNFYKVQFPYNTYVHLLLC